MHMLLFDIVAMVANTMVSYLQTKGPSLEQIALLFDGKDAVVSHANPVAEEFLDEKEKAEAKEIEVAR